MWLFCAVTSDLWLRILAVGFLMFVKMDVIIISNKPTTKFTVFYNVLRQSFAVDKGLIRLFSLAYLHLVNTIEKLGDLEMCMLAMGFVVKLFW